MSASILSAVALAAYAVAFVAGLVAVWTWPSPELPTATAAGTATTSPNGGEAGKAGRRTYAHPVFDIEVQA